MDWTAIGVVITGGALIVSIAALIVSTIIFVIESRRRRSEDTERLARGQASENERARRDSVEKVIDIVERAARAQTRFPFGPVLNRTEFEFAISIPRLLVALPPEDREIGTWVMVRLQEMQALPKAKDATAISFKVALRLAGWQRGEIPTDWFVDELKSKPFDPNFTVSRVVKIRRQLAFSRELAVNTVGGFIAVVTLRNALNTWSR